MDYRTKTAMELRASKVREYQKDKEILIKKIAQLLAESEATCSELSEIFDAVTKKLIVKYKD